jgi:23S rRNA-intervening sequence protein
MAEMVYTSFLHTVGASPLSSISLPLHHTFMAGNYRDLIVWQKAIELTQFINRLTDSFPKREMYGLASQMRRAAVSIPANLGHARGSHLELETELTISWRVELITEEQHRTALRRCEEVGRLINGLLKASATRPPRKPFVTP